MDNKISVVDIALPARRVELLSLLKASLKLMRLSQWVKNGFIFIPLVFSGRLFVVEDVSRTISVALAFCLAASGMYIVNDYMDIDRDRVHPVKKDRPLASGAMPVSAAFLLLSGILLAIIVLAVVEQVPQAGMLALGAYIGLQILYNLKLKELMIIDVLTIAVGFLIRVIAGAVVISVPVSSWLVLCTFSIAIFLALGKRRNEVLVLCGDAPSHRPCLAR
jgi:4-hydroxybenzoate polyprenyltransferase